MDTSKRKKEVSNNLRPNPYRIDYREKIKNKIKEWKNE